MFENKNRFWPKLAYNYMCNLQSSPQLTATEVSPLIPA
jgi:hypothetical protein